jgi:hypothetical protein
VSLRLRASHLLLCFAGLVDGAGWVSAGLGLIKGVAACGVAGPALAGAAGIAVSAELGLVGAWDLAIAALINASAVCVSARSGWAEA